MNEPSFIQLLARLMPSEVLSGNDELDELIEIDKEFDNILTYIKEQFTPLIMSSPCVDKSAIVQQLIDTVGYYRVLGKLREIIGRRMQLVTRSNCYFNAVVVNCYTPIRETWSVNAVGEHVKLSAADMSVIRANKDFSVPVKAFIYGNPSQEEGTVTVFSTSTAEYYGALKYFSKKGLENINICSEIDAILQQAYQYFENLSSYLENKLSILNHDLTMSNNGESATLMKEARHDVSNMHKTAKSSLDEIKSCYKELEPYLKSVRAKLVKLSDGRISEDTPEQAVEPPNYVFSVEQFDNISDEELDWLKGYKFKRNLLANKGEVGAVIQVAIEQTNACFAGRTNEVTEEQIEQATSALELWKYAESKTNLSSRNFEDIAKLHKLLGDGGKKSSYKLAIEYAKKSDTGYSNFTIGKVYEFGNEEAVTLRELKSAEKFYRRALERGYANAKQSLDRVTGKISEKESPVESLYNPEQNYHSSSSSYSSSSGGCFVMTAASRFLGKGSDCYELKAFYDVRDNFMMKLPGGTELLEEYYKIAPKIISRIDELDSDEKEAVYTDIWENYIEPCIEALECGDIKTVFETYAYMLAKLYSKYYVQP